MGRSFQISNVLLVLCLCVAMLAKDALSQTSSIKIGGSCFPYCETAFETIRSVSLGQHVGGSKRIQTKHNSISFFGTGTMH